MKFSIKREVFLQPLSQVIGVVERRQTLPVLANFLFQAQSDGRLAITGTPVENHLVDLWAIFDFLAPGFLGKLSEFQKNYGY